MLRLIGSVIKNSSGRNLSKMTFNHNHGNIVWCDMEMTGKYKLISDKGACEKFAFRSRY